MAETINSLNDMLDLLKDTAEREQTVTLQHIIERVGLRALGPLLFLAGLITLAPVIGDIPGVPTVMAAFVLLISIQLMLGRRHPWLPNWMLRRAVSSERLCKALQWSRKPARFLDRLSSKRLSYLVNGRGQYLVAGFCLVVAAMMPPMEIIPFSANGAGIALCAFGLALIAQDGLLALIAMGVVALFLGIVIYNVV